MGSQTIDEKTPLFQITGQQPNLARMSREGLVWYFAYGSNMSASKFTDSRGIKPIHTANARVPGWMLTTDIPGTPYTEPSYTSIRPITAVDDKPVEVLGLAYLITTEQYIELVKSEGGGIAYEDIALDAVPVSDRDRKVAGDNFAVRTLGTIMGRVPAARPSARYMSLITSGASAATLPSSYINGLHSIPVYHPPTHGWKRFGAWLFMLFWGPVMWFVERLTYASIGPDGNVPAGVGQVVRTTIYVMWAYHDCVHAHIFGRGDGTDQSEQDGNAIAAGGRDWMNGV